MNKKSKNLNFSQLGENISILMEHCEIDATELARESGLPTSTISRLRSNISDFSPNISSLIPIARYFQITVSQLIGEEALPQDICGSFKPTIIKKHFVPLLNTENIYEYIMRDKLKNELFIEVNLQVSNKTFACFTQGSAMEPKFQDKSLLIIDPELTPENLDYVLAISLEKKTILFRQLLTDGEDRYLKTLNPIFNDFVKINNGSHKIAGIIVQSRQNFKSNDGLH
jgi:transcriptional regulator with XRE-family HTH domain